MPDRRAARRPLLLAAMSAIGCAAALPTEDSMSGDREVVTIAHRGASAYAPEHTFAAWDLALAQGADYLEQDLQMTADGVLVVLHDDTLDRTARGPSGACTGAVAERTLAQLQECEVGSWFNAAYPERARPAYATERIPTLAAVLERYAGRARFYIETKNPETAPGMEAALIDLLRDHDLLRAGNGATDRDPPAVILQSFSAASLLTLRRLAPQAFLVQLLPGRASSRSIRARIGEVASYADGIGPRRDAIDVALIDSARAFDLVVHPYTVNEIDAMQRLVEVGVDGMFTDTPDVLRGLLSAAR